LPQPDFGVLKKAQRGDERSFSLIVRAYETPVFNYVLRLVGDRSLAEDLTQEVFLRVFQGLPNFSLRCRFTTWLFQVTKNRVLDELRAIERRPRTLVALDEMPQLEILDPPAERVEAIDAVWRAVDDLDVVGDSPEGRAAGTEVEDEVRRPRVAVTRLPDRAGVQHPAQVGELRLGARERGPERELALRGERERNMAVADEDERCARQLERLDHALTAEDVVPDGVAGAAVEELCPVDLGL